MMIWSENQSFGGGQSNTHPQSRQSITVFQSTLGDLIRTPSNRKVGEHGYFGEGSTPAESGDHLISDIITFCCRFSARIKISRPPAAASAAAVIDLFGFSAGAWRLPNSALRASPKIFLFALSELKNCRRPKRPKRHRRRSLENSARRFRLPPPQTRAGGLGKRKREGDWKRQLPPRSPSRTSKFSLREEDR